MTGASLPGLGHVTPGPTHAGRLSLEPRDLGENTGPSGARCSLRGRLPQAEFPRCSRWARPAEKDLRLAIRDYRRPKGQSTSGRRLRASTTGRPRRGECWERRTACTWKHTCAQPQPPRKASPDLKANTDCLESLSLTGSAVLSELLVWTPHAEQERGQREGQCKTMTMGPNIPTKTAC